MTLVKFNPMTQKIVRSNAIDPFDRLMNDFFSAGNQQVNTTPAVNLIESGDDFFIEMAVPGYQKEDFSIKMENDLLTISTEKELVKQDDMNRLRSEFEYGSFSRGFKISKKLNTESIDAKYENGILKIKLEKLEEAKEKPARTIQIN